MTVATDLNQNFDVLKHRLLIEVSILKRYKIKYSLSFAHIFGNQYSQKILDQAEKAGANACKNGLTRAIQKTAVQNRIADTVFSNKIYEKNKTKLFETIAKKSIERYQQLERRKKITENLPSI